FELAWWLFGFIGVGRGFSGLSRGCLGSLDGRFGGRLSSFGGSVSYFGGSVGCRKGFALRRTLLLQGRGEPGDLRSRGVEQRGGLAEVRLHRACQLGQQRLTALQIGDLLDLGDGQRATAHVAALDDERLVVLG